MFEDTYVIQRNTRSTEPSRQWPTIEKGLGRVFHEQYVLHTLVSSLSNDVLDDRYLAKICVNGEYQKMVHLTIDDVPDRRPIVIPRTQSFCA